MANWLYGEMTGGNGEEGSEGSEESESDLTNLTFDLDNYDEFLDGLVDDMEDVVGDIFEEGDIAEWNWNKKIKKNFSPKKKISSNFQLLIKYLPWNIVRDSDFFYKYFSLNT